MTTTRLRPGALAFVLSLGAVFAACNQLTGGASAQCDGVCHGVDDCNQESCLDYCVRMETSCTVASQSGQFSSWASCGPALSCDETGFTASNCLVQMVGIVTSCKLAASGGTPVLDGSGTSTGPGSGPGRDGGGITPGVDGDVFDSSEPHADGPTDFDSGGSDSALPETDSGFPEDSGGFDAGEPVESGSGCVSTGCTSCDTSCADGDACEDNCGNACC